MARVKLNRALALLWRGRAVRQRDDPSAGERFSRRFEGIGFMHMSLSSCLQERG